MISTNQLCPIQLAHIYDVLFGIPKDVFFKKKLTIIYQGFFLWQGEGHMKKYRLVKWSILCNPKSVGGLGIIGLETKNRSPLSKWLVRLLNEEGIWQDILKKKYLKNKTLAHVEKKPCDPQFLLGLMEIKDKLLARGSY